MSVNAAEHVRVSTVSSTLQSPVLFPHLFASLARGHCAIASQVCSMGAILYVSRFRNIAMKVFSSSFRATDFAISGRLAMLIFAFLLIYFLPDTELYTRMWHKHGSPSHRLIAPHLPDGSCVSVVRVTGSWDNTTGVCNATTGQCVAAPFQAHADWVTCVAYSPDGNHITPESCA